MASYQQASLHKCPAGEQSHRLPLASKLTSLTYHVALKQHAHTPFFSFLVAFIFRARVHRPMAASFPERFDAKKNAVKGQLNGIVDDLFGFLLIEMSRLREDLTASRQMPPPPPPPPPILPSGQPHNGAGQGTNPWHSQSTLPSSQPQLSTPSFTSAPINASIPSQASSTFPQTGADWRQTFPHITSAVLDREMYNFFSEQATATLANSELTLNILPQGSSTGQSGNIQMIDLGKSPFAGAGLSETFANLASPSGAPHPDSSLDELSKNVHVPGEDCLCDDCLMAIGVESDQEKTITIEDKEEDSDQEVEALGLNSSLPTDMLSMSLLFKCSQSHCNANFTCAQDLKEHALVEHPPVPLRTIKVEPSEESNISPQPHKCAHCVKCFVTVMGLYQHTQQYHRKGNFPCKVADCGFAAEYRYQLRKHHYYQHCTLMPCTIPRCRRRFRLQTMLNSHVRKDHETPERENKSKPCYHCKWPVCTGYTSKQKGRVLKHINEHLMKNLASGQSKSSESADKYLEVEQP